MMNRMKLVFRPLSNYLSFLFLIVLWSISSCDVAPSPLVTRDSVVERTNAIIILRITWEDQYIDSKTDELTTVKSKELLKDKINVAAKRVNAGEPQLNSPLYYLSKFRLQFSRDGVEEQVVVTHNLNIHEYEGVVIYQFLPGKMHLGKIVMDQSKYPNEDSGDDISLRWKKHLVEYLSDFGSWDIKPGKAYYLGDFQLSFQSKHFQFGFFSEEQLVEKIELTSVRISDGFNETKKAILQQKPWFPTEEMQNLSFEKELVWEENKLVDKKLMKPTPQKVIDKSKYFF